MRQKETAVIPIPRRMEITAVLHFRAGMTSCLLQFVYAPARKMRDCKGRSRLSARSALQSVSRFEVSAGDPRPVAAGFPIGARSIPVGTRFCFAKSSVLYLCFRLTRERGWRHTLRCGRVWQQTLFRGSRTGGFCDVSYSTNAGFLRSKICLAGKGSEGIYSPRPAAATFPVSAFLPFSLAMGHGRFPALADGSFQVFGQL